MGSRDFLGCNDVFQGRLYEWDQSELWKSRLRVIIPQHNGEMTLQIISVFRFLIWCPIIVNAAHSLRRQARTTASWSHYLLKKQTKTLESTTGMDIVAFEQKVTISIMSCACACVCFYTLCCGFLQFSPIFSHHKTPVAYTQPRYPSSKYTSTVVLSLSAFLCFNMQ